MRLRQRAAKAFTLPEGRGHKGELRMNKTGLIKKVAEKTGFTLKDAGLAVDAIFNAEPGKGIIAAELDAGRKITLTGFGTFYPRHREEKTGINPKTRQPIKIPAKNYPAFRAGKTLKDRVASDEQEASPLVKDLSVEKKEPGRIKIEVKISKVDMYGIKVGDIKRSAQGGGTIYIELPSGEHELTYDVRGRPGSIYKVEITSPSPRLTNKKDLIFDDETLPDGAGFGYRTLKIK